MARSDDIGDFFDRLTQRGRGGRRLDGSEPSERSSPPPSRSSGGLKDSLRDALAKGRTTAKRTTEKVVRKPKGGSGGAPGGRGRLAPESVVRIEYSPRRDGDPDPGEVVWAWVPFEEDPSQGKDRPVVIIGRRGDSLVGVPLTTKPDEREAQVEMGTGDWDPQRRVSYARIWRMLDVDPDRTRREGSALDRERFDRLVAAVDHYYDIAPAAPVGHANDRYDY